MVIRVLLASAGNYAATYALVALIAPRIPMARMDAVLLSTCLAFPIMVGLALWAFAQPRVWKVGAAFSAPVILLAAERLL